MCADQILAKQARISELSRISKDHTQRKGVFWQGQKFIILLMSQKFGEH